MKLYYKLCLIVLYLLLVGCDVQRWDFQKINIDIYESKEENARLAEEILYYDPLYLLKNIEMLDELTIKGVSIGYQVDTKSGLVYYKITYDLMDTNTKTSLTTLKDGFSNFIPYVVNLHSAKESLFDSLSEKGKKWLEPLFHGDEKSIYTLLPSEEKSSDTATMILSTIKSLLLSYGDLNQLNYVNSQYYLDFKGIDEFVVTNYLGDFGEVKVHFRLVYQQLNGKWSIIGFSHAKSDT